MIELSGMEAEISRLIDDINRTNTDVSAQTPAALQSAAEVIRQEQARLLGKVQFKRDKKGHTYKYINPGLIKIQAQKATGNRIYRVKIGYDTETIREFPELLLVEFGRPGISPRRSKPTDSLGRKKGDFPPHYSHIRAGYDLAKERAIQTLNEKLLETATRNINRG